ncbi:WS/DGAT/MGAT family O-acyltransferase [Amycolatopsis suaedae]|uniref:Diacylglycerol O-acyltransferase n=1 Tax=Amycolatopsis suaedae TaxID=2510978 RepID=A0A4Q7J9P8_9PSEU|nr:wax ester/triacylglycerol synthase family O-acyltransferase [Amycolatopsis suaedae]RZQ63153.1 wax ester/triacylglycerol synthase family O-acyltransferase [Amycolatopsis suaedae]
MQRLSGLDASFLYLETSAQPLNICGVAMLDGTGFSFARFARRLAGRVTVTPAFRRRLYNPPLNFTHPLWVDDEDFDLDHHLHHIAVPAPGGRRELAELCAHLAAQPLDRRKPLWEMYVISGLDPETGGTVAVLVKTHHANADGVGGANLVAALASTEPDAQPPEPPGALPPPPNPLRLLAGSAVALVRQPLDVARLLPELVAMAPRWVGRALRGQGMPVPFTAPRTSLNGTITGHRSVAWASVGLDEIKAVKNAFDVTVNDVVLAVCAGALREFLLARAELPDEPLVATVPVSVHGRTERADGSNKVSAFFAALPTHLPDPAARVFALAEGTRLAKEHHHSIHADMLADWAQFSGPIVFGLAVRAYSALRLADRHPVVHNLVVSNVAGPPMPLYLLGSRITGLYPFGPVFHGAALNLTVLSYDGRVHVGLIAARELVPDLWSLADGIPRALRELADAR